jgi:hypothetical protein
MANRDFEAASGPVPHMLPSKETQPEAVQTSSTVDRDPVDRVTCRAGDESCAHAHASTLNRSTSSGPAVANRSLLQLQRQYGNRYVERVLSLSQATADREQQHDVGHSASGVSPNVEGAIEQERGAGHGLDAGVKRHMESSLGADFGGVRVHTDQRSDSLNRALSARAFTTGQDVFFREGAYQPGSSIGRELIAHELTHVVQQNGNTVKRAMSVSQPGDPHEVEAEQTARAVIQQEHATVSRQDDKDEGHALMASQLASEGAQRQPEAPTNEEEEKKKHAMAKADGAMLSRFAERNDRRRAR